MLTFTKETGKPIGIKLSRAVRKYNPIECYQINEPFTVGTITGEVVKGRKGDYLMIEDDEDMYPCAKEILGKNYNLIDTYLDADETEFTIQIKGIKYVLERPVFHLFHCLSLERDNFKQLLAELHGAVTSNQ